MARDLLLGALAWWGSENASLGLCLWTEICREGKQGLRKGMDLWRLEVGRSIWGLQRKPPCLERAGSAVEVGEPIGTKPCKTLLCRVMVWDFMLWAVGCRGIAHGCHGMAHKIGYNSTYANVLLEFQRHHSGYRMSCKDCYIKSGSGVKKGQE